MGDLPIIISQVQQFEIIAGKREMYRKLTKLSERITEVIQSRVRRLKSMYNQVKRAKATADKASGGRKAGLMARYRKIKEAYKARRARVEKLMVKRAKINKKKAGNRATMTPEALQNAKKGRERGFSKRRQRVDQAA